jgi:hypothetical protein
VPPFDEGRHQIGEASARWPASPMRPSRRSLSAFPCMAALPCHPRGQKRVAAVSVASVGFSLRGGTTMPPYGAKARGGPLCGLCRLFSAWRHNHTTRKGKSAWRASLWPLSASLSVAGQPFHPMGQKRVAAVSVPSVGFPLHDTGRASARCRDTWDRHQIGGASAAEINIFCFLSRFCPVGLF